MFERYTDEARRVVVVSQEEARALRHNYIGTEHLLLALLRLPPDSAVGSVLAGLGLTHEDVRARVLALVSAGEDPSVGGQLPFTPRAKRALEMSLREALNRGDDQIGSVHVLLGVAGGDKDGVAVRVLREQQVTSDQVRAAALAALPLPEATPSPRSILRRSRRTTVHQRPIEIDLSDEARRLLMSAGARALDDGRTLIEIADIEEALRRRGDTEEPPPQSATG